MTAGFNDGGKGIGIQIYQNPLSKSSITVTNGSVTNYDMGIVVQPTQGGFCSSISLSNLYIIGLNDGTGLSLTSVKSSLISNCQMNSFADGIDTETCSNGLRFVNVSLVNLINTMTIAKQNGGVIDCSWTPVTN